MYILNSGYCTCTKQDMGFKNFHPKDVWNLPGCREIDVPTDDTTFFS